MTKPDWNSGARRFAALGVMLFTLAGCDSRSGEAIVLEKEHIPVAEVAPSPSPAASQPPAVDSAPEPGATPEPDVVTDEGPGPDLRGTSKDPRASDHEQWIATVQMVADRRRVEVRVERERWAALKEGDRVRVRYKVGRYTGTIWDSELE